MKKTLKIGIVMVLSLTTFYGCTNNGPTYEQLLAELGDERYIYPIQPGSEEWVKLDDIEARINASQIPEETLESMSTRVLVQAVLDYPLLVNLQLFNTFSGGFNWVKEYFNGLRELVSREDGASELLRVYLSIEPPTLDDTSNVWNITNLEILLAQPVFYDKLTAKQKDSLFASNEKKHFVKKGSEKIMTNILQMALDQLESETN